MKQEMRNSGRFQEQRLIVVYLDSLSKRVNELPTPALSGRRLHTLSGTRAESQAELPPTLRSGDASPSGTMARDALLPSVLDRAFRGEF